MFNFVVSTLGADGIAPLCASASIGRVVTEFGLLYIWKRQLKFIHDDRGLRLWTKTRLDDSQPGLLCQSHQIADQGSTYPFIVQVSI